MATHASDLSYSNVGVSYCDGDFADLDADGVRWLLAPQFEANIFPGFADIDSEDDTLISISFIARFIMSMTYSVRFPRALELLRQAADSLS